MPCINGERTGSNWAKYLAIGCGSCLVLSVITLVGVGLFIRHTMQQAFNAMSTPQPQKPLSAYKFDYPNPARCTITLPDGSGITYMHVLGSGNGHIYGEGQRCIRLTHNGLKSIDRPLKYYPAADVRVGLYWYPKKNGKGPYLRLYDSIGDIIVDFDRKITRGLYRTNNRVYAGNYVDLDNYSDFGTEIEYNPDGSVKIVKVTFDNKPAEDVTSLFGLDNGKYLGSIVRVGNTLVFKPASKTK